MNDEIGRHDDLPYGKGSEIPLAQQTMQWSRHETRHTRHGRQNARRHPISQQRDFGDPIVYKYRSGLLVHGKSEYAQRSLRRLIPSFTGDHPNVRVDPPPPKHVRHLPDRQQRVASPGETEKNNPVDTFIHQPPPLISIRTLVQPYPFLRGGMRLRAPFGLYVENSPIRLNFNNSAVNQGLLKKKACPNPAME
jgi:hypothetical protein